MPAGPGRVLLALAAERGSLARLRADRRTALVLVGEGDVAVTLHGRARVLVERLASAPGVAAVELVVERIQDHGKPQFEIESGIGWRWTDPEAADRDATVRAELAALATR